MLSKVSPSSTYFAGAEKKNFFAFFVYGVIKLIYLLFYPDIASRFTQKLNDDEWSFSGCVLLPAC
jgi:hypothetical protein